MGQRADGDEVDAGFGVRTDGRERDAARGLEPGPAPGERDGLAALLRAHVVQQDPADARVECLANLRERLGLDLDVAAAVQRGNCRRDPARAPEMVLLDEDGVVETGTMVRAAAAPDGVLLERPQPGRRVARVEDGRAAAVDELDEAA